MTIKAYDDPRLPKLDSTEQADLDIILKAQACYFSILAHFGTQIPIKHYRVIKRTSAQYHRQVEQAAKLKGLFMEKAKIEAELS